jgi:hypothetical protein
MARGVEPEVTNAEIVLLLVLVLLLESAFEDE